MGTFGRHLGALTRLFSAVSLSAALTFSTGLISVALVVVPLTRSAESGESGSSKERCEELSFTRRLDQDRHLCLDICRVVSPHATAMRDALGHAQRPVLDPPAGHRFPNGLLAPLTC